jgi:predicted Zn-dependent peptidase
MPEFREAVLPNGLRLLVAPRTDIPLAEIHIVVGGGYRRDFAEGVPGLTQVASRTLLFGGGSGSAVGKTWLESQGILYGIQPSPTESVFRLSCLPSQLGELAGILASMLREPAFPVEVLEEARSTVRNQIRQRADSADATALMVLQEALEQTPAGRRNRLELTDVDAIQTEQLRLYRTRRLHPANVQIALWGSVDFDSAKALFEKELGTWRATAPPAAALAPASEGKPIKSVLLASLRGVERSSIMAATSAVSVAHPDYPALLVWADILEYRLRQALQTSLLGSTAKTAIVAGLDTRPDGNSRLVVQMTATASYTVQSVDFLRREFAAALQQPVTAKETTEAIRRVLQEQASLMESPNDQLSYAALLRFHFPDPGLLANRQRVISTLEAATVAKASAAHISPDPTIVVAGEETQFLPPFDGTAISRVDLSLTGPSTQEAEPSKENIAEAATWLARLRQALGGEARLESMRDFEAAYHSTSSATSGATAGPSRVVDRWLREPASFRQEQFAKPDAPPVIAFYDGKVAWMGAGRRVIPAPPLLLVQLRSELFRVLATLAYSDRMTDRTIRYAGSGVVVIHGPDGNRVRLYLSEETGLPNRISYQWAVGANLMLTEDSVHEWKQTDGLQWPGRVTTRVNGEYHSEIVLESLKINTGITAAQISQKP